MQKFFRLLRFARPYLRNAVLNVVCNILGVVFSLFSLTLVIPFLGMLFGTQKLVTTPVPYALTTGAIAHNFQYLLSQIIITYGKVEALIFINILVATAFLLKNLFRYLALYFITPMRTGIVRDLRQAVFERLLHLHIGYFTTERKGDLLSRMTSDVQEVEWSVLNSLEALFREPVSILLFLGTLIAISPLLSLFVFVLLPATGFVIGRVGRSLRKQGTAAQQQTGRLFSLMEEALGGLRIIKSSGVERFVGDRFLTENETLARLNRQIMRRRDLASPMSEALGALVMVALMWFGGRLVLSGQGISAEAFIGYIVIFSQLIDPAKSFANSFYNVRKGMASAERIEEILRTEPAIQSVAGALPLTTLQTGIELRDVSFSYGDRNVLRHINLSIPKGKMVALVGASGGGKSTLADLVPRFYDVTGGQVLVDGTDVRQLELRSLRTMMGIVSQETVLFNDTILNNIAFGIITATRAEVMAAAKIANAHTFIEAMPEGYDTNIGDRGVRLSGGQRQRLSIARAVLRNPPVLILDEATSALDTESERLVQDALQRLMRERTSLVIAHRLSTVQHADEIVVLQEGQIVERGTHASLMAQQGAYFQLVELQQVG